MEGSRALLVIDYTNQRSLVHHIRMFCRHTAGHALNDLAGDMVHGLTFSIGSTASIIVQLKQQSLLDPGCCFFALVVVCLLFYKRHLQDRH